MIKIIISGFEKNIGPGDIVGAFINECGVSNKDIGKINITNNKAEVELEDRVAARVIDTMDNNQIGGVKVKVNPANPNNVMPPDLVSYLKEKQREVKQERDDYNNKFSLEIKHYSPEIRERRGQALTGLKGRYNGRYFDNRKLLLLYRVKAGQELPVTFLTIGDQALVRPQQEETEEEITVEIVDISSYYLLLAIEGEFPDFLTEEKLMLDKFYHDGLYNQSLQVLEELKNPQGSLKKLRDVALLDREEPQWLPGKVRLKNWYNNNLVPEQKSAVQRARKAQNFFLVDGGAGTGRTETLIEILKQALGNGEKVLLLGKYKEMLADIARRLLPLKEEKVWLGSMVFQDKELEEIRLINQVLEDKNYLAARRLEIQALDLKLEKDRISSGKKIAGIDIDKQQVNQRLQERLQVLAERIKDKKESAVASVIEEAQLVFATPTELARTKLTESFFDLLIVDDANSIAEIELLPALTKARRFVLAGDAKEEENNQLYNRLYSEKNQHFYQHLKIQHRLSSDLMDFINDNLCQENNCVGDIGASYKKRGQENQQQRERQSKLEELGMPEEKALLGGEELVFIDTKNLLAKEEQYPGSNSYYNSREAEIVLDLLSTALSSGLKADNIGALTFFSDQYRYLKGKLNRENLFLAPLESWQGLEREIIILSTVRSNDYGYLGPLQKPSLLRKALSRTVGKAIILGDSSLLSREDFYNKVIEHCQNEGLYLKL